MAQPLSKSLLPDDSGIALPMILKHLEPFDCFPVLRASQSWYWTLLTDTDYSLKIPVLRSIVDKYHIEQLGQEKKHLQGEAKEKIEERIRNAVFWINGAENFFPVPLATLMERKECDFLVQEICDASVQIALKKAPRNIGVIVSAISAQYEKRDLLSSLKMVERVRNVVENFYEEEYAQHGSEHVDDFVIAYQDLKCRESDILSKYLPWQEEEEHFHNLEKVCKTLLPEDTLFLLNAIQQARFNWCVFTRVESFLTLRQLIMQQIKEPSCAHIIHPLTLIANRLLFEVATYYFHINERKKAFELLDTLQNTVAEQKDRIGLLFRLVIHPLSWYINTPELYEDKRELVVQLLDRGLKRCHELRLTPSDVAESDLWPWSDLWHWAADEWREKILYSQTIENYFSRYLKLCMEHACLKLAYDPESRQAVSNFAEFIQNKWESWKRDNQYN